MEKQKKEITIGYLWGVLKKSLIVLIVATVVAGVLGGLYAKLIVKPTYQATAGFWINNTTAGSDYTSTAQTSAASDVAANCVELAKMDKPVRRAVQNHNLTEVLGIENENDCVKKVTKMIKAFKEEKSSGIFYVSVTADDPKVAHAVMTAIEAEFPEVIKELYGFKHDTNRGEFVSVVNEIGEDRKSVV